MCKCKAVLAAFFLFVVCLPAALNATDMRGGGYRSLLGVFPAMHVNERMSGGDGYVLFGSIGQVGTGNISGGGYTVTAGVISSLQPAELTLENAYAYPNPYRPSKGHTKITFTKLTESANIKIYTVSGELVRGFDKQSTNDSMSWDVLGDAGQKLASGLYIYIITSGDMKKSGKLLIIK